MYSIVQYFSKLALYYCNKKKSELKYTIPHPVGSRLSNPELG